MARVLVTGATGFVGRHLVAHLVGRGDAVRCLVRLDSECRQLGALDVDCVFGDVTVASSLIGPLSGAEVVYHLAGATQVVNTRQYWRVNAEGTRNLAAECARLSQPPRVVFVSSLAAAGPSAPDRPRVETDPPAPVSEYGRSKLVAEGYLRNAPSLRVTVLRPPGVLGPGDPHTLPLFRAARRGVNGAPGSSSYRLSWIEVGDLARALVLAAERGDVLSAGADDRGVYFVAMDETPTYTELGQIVGAAVGRSWVRTVSVPRPLCRLAGWANDLRARLTGRPLLLSADKMREGTAGSWTCCSDKAKREMGFACQTGLAEALRRGAEWYAAQGLL